eukprot:1456558-Pleurochrysis_carterae.AAC.1
MRLYGWPPLGCLPCPPLPRGWPPSGGGRGSFTLRSLAAVTKGSSQRTRLSETVMVAHLRMATSCCSAIQKCAVCSLWRCGGRQAMATST